MMRARLLLLVLWAGLTGCIGRQPANDARQTVSQSETRLAPYQGELLELAFAVASRIPVNPHIADRSTCQENVVKTCLELGEPERALRYADRIANWRRGSAYADLAAYYVRHGAKKDRVEPYLEASRQEAARAEDWHKARINVKIAGVLACLGEGQQADRLGADVEPSETGKVQASRAMASDANGLDEQVKIMDAMIAPGNFDVVRNVLEAYGQLFGRFYGDGPRRSQLEERIRASWDKLPVFVRIELLMTMAGSALDHQDPTKAQGLVDEGQQLMDAATWPAEYRIPMAARLAVLRFRSGGREKARLGTDALRGLFDAEKAGIPNIYRAGVLRPIAEAYQAIGDRRASLELYGRAVEAGVENPNSRPRAEDLAATCCSMALRGAQPDASLWGRIRTIQGGLGEPW